MSRAIALLVVLVAELAAAQVANVCGAGKNCQVQSIKTSVGSCTAPTYSWSNDTDTGFFWQQSGGMVACANGIRQYRTNGGSALYLQGDNVWMLLDTGGFANVNGAQLQLAGSGTTSITGYGSGSVGNGTAFASFPTCNASLLGRLLFDSTNTQWRFCDGAGTWVFLVPSASGGTYPTRLAAANGFTAISSMTATAASEETNFLGTLLFSNNAGTPTTTDQVSCNWETAGTGGTTGVVVRVFDVTASSSICTCTLGACTTASRAPLGCKCTGTMTAGNQYAVRLSSATDCTVNPQNVVCNVAVVP